MNRRSFVTKSGLLLGSLGLAGAFRQDLVGSLSETLLPSARAEGMEPRRVLEICFRYGIPMIIFGTGNEFTKLTSRDIPISPTRETKSSRPLEHPICT